MRKTARTAAEATGLYAGAIAGTLALSCTAGCASDGADSPFQQMSLPSTILPNLGDESEDLAGSPLRDRWRPCADQSDCLEVEQCVRGFSESFNLCAAPCEDVDDCVGASLPEQSNVASAVTCSELEGAKRCVLSCTSADECMPGMACVLSTCVWR